MDIPGHLFRQHLFTEHLLGPGTVLGTGDTGVNENERFLSLMAFTLYWGRETTSYIARKQNISNSFRIQSAVKKNKTNENGRGWWKATGAALCDRVPREGLSEERKTFANGQEGLEQL